MDGMVLYKQNGRFCPRISTLLRALFEKSGGGGDGKHHPSA
ncbi:hypothetical protein [Paenibacillus sp. ICGEB2008]|nr:hypothetical protein [Paenibacillus sp. ICGEB2008]